MVFMIVFLVGTAVSAYMYKDYMLGYGPWEASSEHGKAIDHLFNVTLVLTGIVFVITHVLLFWYSYKYRSSPSRKAIFFAHDTKLELIWTAIPAIVMAYLVANGLKVWNDVMPDIGPNEQYIEIEATGYQFAWDIRYPGADGILGAKDYRLIDLANNSLGINFNDEKSYDDVVLSGADRIILPVDQTVRVQITAKDVLHNFYLPHFRVKMDAVPGLPGYFIFKPTKTTAQMRSELSAYPEWNELSDPSDPESPKRWEVFDYELACAELCGSGHYSMRRIVEIVDQGTYNAWASGLASKSFYKNNIRGTDLDPNKDARLMSYEIESREKELDVELTAALNSAQNNKKETQLENAIIRFKNVFFATGGANLEEDSYYELDYVASVLNKYPDVKIEIAGHSDNTGDAGKNRTLSQARADVVKDRLISKGVSESRLASKGYGDVDPIDSNDTDEGRAANRRTELVVISK